MRNKMNTSSISDNILHTIAVITCILALIITLYPFIYVLSMSISKPINVMKGNVWLFPVGFDFRSYVVVFQNKEFFTSYSNTIYYTVFGTILNIIMTVIAAYPLSVKKFFLRKQLLVFFVITMYFSGGIVPYFMVVQKIGLYDTRWVMIITGALAAIYIIIAMTFFKTIPNELIESVKLDGAGELQTIIYIIWPLSLPIIAALAIYYGVTHWNSYFDALLFLPSRELQPIQLLLARVLTQYSNEMSNKVDMVTNLIGTDFQKGLFFQMKYTVIVVVILPIIFLYPFLQKYFVKGIMIGSLKG